MFQAEPKYITRGVHVTIMQRTAIATYPGSYTKLLKTFRSGKWKGTAFRTDLGTEFFVDNVASCSRRNRLVLKHSAKHRPACVRNGLGHLSFLQSGWAGISDCDKPIGFSNPCAFDMQKVRPLPSDLGGQTKRLPLLLAPLVERQLLLCETIELRRFNLGTVAQCGESFQAKINTDCRAVLSFPVRQLDLDIDEPMALAVAGEIPGLWDTSLRDRTRHPQGIGSTEEGQCIVVQSRRTLEIGERYPIEIALGRPEAWSLRKVCPAAVRKLGADGINGIRVNTKFFGNTPAKIGQVEGGWTFDVPAGAVTGRGDTVSFRTEVPNKIDGAGLRSKRTSNSLRSVFDPVAKRQYHRDGRLSGCIRNSSRDRGVFQHPRFRPLYLTFVLTTRERPSSPA